MWINSLADTDKNFRINSSGGEIDDNLWNDTLPASTVFSIGSAAEVSGNSIAYCFAEKQGFSKFGGTALEANTANAEADIGATGYDIDFLSNGFKHRQGNTYTNASGSKYIYMAFAEHPFVTSTGIPTTAR